MAVTINADNGAVSGSAGLKSTADGSGILALQTNGTTAISIDTSQNATLSKSLILAGSTSGTATISAPAVAGSTVVTLPAQTGTAVVAGPAFAAYLSAGQTVTSGTITQAALNTELFDTASRFNNTNATVGGIPAYAFLPNVAGYYQVNFAVLASAGTAITYAAAYIYKDGAAITRNAIPGWSGTNADSNASRIVYMDGTSNYLQFYGQVVGTGTLTMLATEARTLASVSFIRPA
jgi:hypothetical protein